jgi:WD40 repeat protein
MVRWVNKPEQWDCESGRELATLTGRAYPVEACTFSPDGSKVISMSGETTRIWDAAARTRPITSGKESASRERAQAEQVYRGRFKLTISDSGTLELVDLQTGDDVCEFVVRNSLVAFAIRDGGDIVAEDAWGTEYVLRPESLF